MLANIKNGYSTEIRENHNNTSERKVESAPGEKRKTESVKFEQLSFPQELASPQQKAIQRK